jgi:hypothetical protein
VFENSRQKSTREIEKRNVAQMDVFRRLIWNNSSDKKEENTRIQHTRALTSPSTHIKTGRSYGLGGSDKVVVISANSRANKCGKYGEYFGCCL